MALEYCLSCLALTPLGKQGSVVLETFDRRSRYVLRDALLARGVALFSRLARPTSYIFVCTNRF
jgi:broad specificity phosphatase PhoE